MIRMKTFTHATTGKRRTMLAAAISTLILGLWPTGSWAQAAPSNTIKRGDTVPFVVLTLRAHGFEPSKITVAHSPFILHIINRLGGADDPVFTIEGAGATKVHQSNASQNRTDAWRLVTLQKGTYVGKMSNHNTATVQIEVTQ